MSVVYQELGGLVTEATESDNVAKTTILHACSTKRRGAALRSRNGDRSTERLRELGANLSPVWLREFRRDLPRLRTRNADLVRVDPQCRHREN